MIYLKNSLSHYNFFLRKRLFKRQISSVKGALDEVIIIIWLRRTVVERRSLAGELSLSHARLAVDG